MTEVNNARGGLLGRVVSLDEVRACNEFVDHSSVYNYRMNYKYDPSTLPDLFDVDRFCNYDKSDAKEVAILQNAVRCLKALEFGPKDTSILDEYADDTLLTFDYDTGKILFDEEAFKRDSDVHKNKQHALIAEYNKIAESSTLANAIENAKKLQQIKSKIAELQESQPDKSDAKYNRHEIVKGSTSVKQVVDRYKELCELQNKYDQEWKQYMLDYKHRNAKKLSISEDTFKVFKELYNADVFKSGTLNASCTLCYDALRCASVKDFNENSWKNVSFDARDEGRKFLNQKQFKLWRKYGSYTRQFDAPRVVDWMMYDHFNDTDLMWLNALKAFNERVTALKRIEEQHTDACEQHTNACEQHTNACEQHTDACEQSK